MSLKVLIVDDSKTMRDMVSFTLRNADHNVLVAHDGDHALEVLNGQEVDLVITDINMPSMNGLVLIGKLREMAQYKTIPILVLTTEADVEKKNEGREAGATGWIVKPFNPEKLLKVVAKVCP